MVLIAYLKKKRNDVILLKTARSFLALFTCLLILGPWGNSKANFWPWQWKSCFYCNKAWDYLRNSWLWGFSL